MNKESTNSLKIFFVIFIFFGIAYTIIDPLIPLISERLGIGYDRIGLILFASASISLVSTFLSGRFSDKYDIKKIIMTGIILTSAGFLIYGVFFSFLIFLLTVIFFRVGSGILDSSVHAYVSKRYPRRQSALFVKLDLFWYLGAITGPLAVSIFLYTGLNVSYVFLGFLAAIIIALFLFIKFYAVLEEKIKSGKETGIIYTLEVFGNLGDQEGEVERRCELLPFAVHDIHPVTITIKGKTKVKGFLTHQVPGRLDALLHYRVRVPYRKIPIRNKVADPQVATQQPQGLSCLSACCTTKVVCKDRDT